MTIEVTPFYDATNRSITHVTADAATRHGVTAERAQSSAATPKRYRFAAQANTLR